MEIQSQEDARKNVNAFAHGLADFLLRKKAIDAEIKEFKEEYTAEGVPVQAVASLLNKMKAQKKKTESQIFEEETMGEWLEADKELDDKIGELAAKA